MSAETALLTQTLRRLRRRLIAQAFVRDLAACALFAGGALVIAGVTNRWLLGKLPWNGEFAVATGGAAFAIALLLFFVRRRSLGDVAKVIDRVGRTHDRFVTALALDQGTGAGKEMRALALRECEQFARGRDFHGLITWQIPREIPFLLVPAVALLMLHLEARLAFAHREQQRAEGQAEVEKTARKLEQLAREAEKASEEMRAEELKRIAAQLKRSAEESRAEAATREQGEKAALRQLSQLEALVQEMQRTQANVSPEEMKELAKVLAQNEATKEAAAAMQAGELERAAKELEEATKKDELTADQLRKTLEEALQRLAAKRKLSEQLEQLAQQLQQRSGSGTGLNEALQRLAQMLRQMQQQNGARDGKSRQQTLNNLLSALQNLKFGAGDNAQGSSDAPPNNETGQVMIQAFGDQKGGTASADLQLPTGLPGSERDVGTTATPFAENRQGEGEKGAEVTVKGRLGEGESLSALLPSAGDQSKSARRYKELYEAMAPAAEEAVLQENIPLGSRFFIKRYFEAIRPRE